MEELYSKHHLEKNHYGMAAGTMTARVTLRATVRSSFVEVGGIIRPPQVSLRSLVIVALRFTVVGSAQCLRSKRLALMKYFSYV